MAETGNFWRAAAIQNVKTRKHLIKKRNFPKFLVLNAAENFYGDNHDAVHFGDANIIQNVNLSQNLSRVTKSVKSKDAAEHWHRAPTATKKSMSVSNVKIAHPEKRRMNNVGSVRGELVEPWTQHPSTGSGRTL